MLKGLWHSPTDSAFCYPYRAEKVMMGGKRKKESGTMGRFYLEMHASMSCKGMLIYLFSMSRIHWSNWPFRRYATHYSDNMPNVSSIDKVLWSWRLVSGGEIIATHHAIYWWFDEGARAHSFIRSFRVPFYSSRTCYNDNWGLPTPESQRYEDPFTGIVEGQGICHCLECWPAVVYRPRDIRIGPRPI